MQEDDDCEKSMIRRNKSSSTISYRRQSSTADEKFRSSVISDKNRKPGSGFSVSSHILSSSSIRVADQGAKSDLANFLAQQEAKEKEETTEKLNRQTMRIAAAPIQRTGSKTFKLDSVPEIKFDTDNDATKPSKKKKK